MGLYLFGFWEDSILSTLIIMWPFFRSGNGTLTTASATTNSDQNDQSRGGSPPGAQLRRRETRVELRCGENDAIAAAEDMYKRALAVAERFGIDTYFDRTWDHGDQFCDGYIYPRLENLEQVLDELDRAGVDYDNVDLPSSVHENSGLYKRLRRRYPVGVSVNLNGYGLP